MIKVSVQRNLIGLEDLLIGLGTVNQVRGPASSAAIPITRINGANLPYDADYSLQEKFDELQGQMDSLPIVVDDDGDLLTGLIDSSSSDIGGTHTNRLWRRTIDANEARIYWADQLILAYNPTTGGIIIPEDTDYVAADAVVTAAFEAADDAITAAYIAADDDMRADYEAADDDLQDQIDDLAADLGAFTGVPIGTIVWVPYSTPDTDWLELNGQVISRTTYATLFGKIGTTYGAGDGSTTFALPDVRGEFIRGFDNARGIDTGRTIGSNQAEAFLSHTHGLGTLATASAGDHTHNVPYTDNTGSGSTAVDEAATGPVGNVPTSSNGAHTHTLTGALAAAGGLETRPRNIAFMAQIKAL